MKDIVEFIVKQFVTNPDAVEVTEEEQDGFIRVMLKVDPSDMGLTIGKNGHTIKAIRRLLTIKAISDNVRVNLELIDSGVPATTESETEQEESAAPAPVESETEKEEAPTPDPEAAAEDK